MTPAKYPWEANTLYEPAPIKRSTWRVHPYLWLAGIAIASGALIALQPIYEAVK
jgi:hypothetical protein